MRWTKWSLRLTARPSRKPGPEAVAPCMGRAKALVLDLAPQFLFFSAFSIEINAVDHIAYVWDEFCDKAGHPQEKVGDVKACTYGGKPVVRGDVTMGDALGSDPFAKASAPAAPSVAKGAGKAKGS